MKRRKPQATNGQPKHTLVRKVGKNVTGKGHQLKESQHYPELFGAAVAKLAKMQLLYLQDDVLDDIDDSAVDESPGP